MTVQPFRLAARPAPAVSEPLEPYFSFEPVTPPVHRLRPLTALEQMYAYWGSDRV